MRVLKKTVLCILALIVFVLPLSACTEDHTEDIRFRSLTWAVSTPLPQAEDFLVEPLPEGYSIAYAEHYSFTELKQYTLTLLVTSPRGKTTTHDVTFDLVLDEQAPVVTGLRDHLVYLNGGGISYFAGVSTADNCDGAVTLELDNTGVNLKKVGVYPVYYIATDAAGNRAVYRMTVSVAEREITEEMLWAEIDPIIDSMITDGMSLKDQVWEIYDYVYDHIGYSSTTDNSSWVRAAYEGITTGYGDCYTYFALSKAFFERLGIENVDVQRSATVVAKVDERHFWSLVNIGTDSEPRWYHFDACHIKDNPKPWGYLMTDAQLAAYSNQKVSKNGVRNYFYAFDRVAYPATPTQKINTDY